MYSQALNVEGKVYKEKGAYVKGLSQRVEEAKLKAINRYEVAI